jgi:hypothetical protein
MDSRLKGQRPLAQFLLFTAFPNFLTQASKYRSCAHTQGLIQRKGAVQTLYCVFLARTPGGGADVFLDEFELSSPGVCKIIIVRVSRDWLLEHNSA